MRIIISPAKKMRSDTDAMPIASLPAFLPRTRQILSTLKGMTGEALQKLWKCNDAIAQLNLQRLEGMILDRGLTPAILAYEGIQYQYMSPAVFTHREYAYVQQHLRILSGFYGLLRPFDGVTPYRLEMQANLSVGPHRDLYSFWGDALARQLFSETDCVINLASKEYSQCVSKYLPPDKRMITCLFVEEKNGKLLEKGTLCKMARGEMVRFMAENQAQTPDELKAFDRLDFVFAPQYSDSRTFVFLQRKKETTPDF